MVIKPILFNIEMVRAILDGRKTCARRLVRFLPGENPQWTGYIRDGLMLYNGRNEPCIMKSPYQPGDILYVRETWQRLWELDGNENVIAGTDKYYYKATDTLPTCEYIDPAGKIHENVPWHPSVHMPKEAARIWLKVTDVRLERLQDITSEQIYREGTEVEEPFVLNGEEKRYAFSVLWNSTIKKSDLDRYGWDANPWVWVIEFEPCEKPEGV